jgi:phosphopantetheine adenylyltransferase
LEDKTVLFSGRFDDFHKSHIATIQRLGQKYKKVLVVILDHPEQYYPVTYRKQAIVEILGNSRGSYEVSVNSIHFGEITKEELDKFGADVYASGNLKVLKHIENLGMECLYVERAYEDHATDARKFQQIKEVLR